MGWEDSPLFFAMMIMELNMQLLDDINYRLRDRSLYFKSGISWGDVTSGAISLVSISRLDFCS